jgi:hypothetical protein
MLICVPLARDRARSTATSTPGGPMDRTYTLKLHRAERVGALFDAQLYRVSDDGVELVAEVDRSYSALGIGDVFEAFTDQVIVHQNEHGELP